MICIPTAAKHPSLRRRQVLTLPELDAVLGVDAARFDATVHRLVREMRATGARLAVPVGVDALAAVEARPSWQRLFEAQAHRLARLGRDAELAMARRYDFVRERASAALREAGYPAEDVPRLLRLSRKLQPPAPRRRSRALHAHLECALHELEALRNLYIEGALYLVPGCAQRYRNLGVDWADLIQEGSASLFQAIEGFDWRRDVRFKTYAQYWIQQAILKVLYNASRTVRVPVWVQKAVAKIKRVRDGERGPDGAPASLALVGERLGLAEERVRGLLETKRFATSLDAEVGEDGVPLIALLPDDRSPDVVDSIPDGDLGERLHEVLAELPRREQMILTRRFGLGGGAPETLGEIAKDLGITAERVRQLQSMALSRLQRPGKMERLRAFA